MEVFDKFRLFKVSVLSAEQCGIKEVDQLLQLGHAEVIHQRAVGDKQDELLEVCRVGHGEGDFVIAIYGGKGFQSLFPGGVLFSILEFQMGQEAARMFLRQLEQPEAPPETRILQTRFVVRESARG